MVTENSALSQRYEVLRVELQPEGDFYPGGWGQDGNCLVEAVAAAPTPGLSQSHPPAYLGSPPQLWCCGLCEVTMTQSSQPMRPLLCLHSRKKQGDVLSKEASSDPPLPGNDLALSSSDKV